MEPTQIFGPSRLDGRRWQQSGENSSWVDLVMNGNEDKRAIDELDARLQHARQQPLDPLKQKIDKKSEKGSPLGLAFRVSIEITSAVAVGVVIGWLADEYFGTRPWLMLVFIVLGAAAGMLNVYRVASNFGYAVGYRKDTDRTEKSGPDEG